MPDLPSLGSLKDMAITEKSHQRYSLLNGDYLNETDPEQGGSETLDIAEQRPRWRLRSILALSILFNGVLAVLYIFKEPTDWQCASQLSVWSPLNELIEYEERDFDNAFAHDTIYRGPPTQELEHAWADLWLYDGVRFPEDKLPLVNRTPDLGNGRTLKAVDDEEGGYHVMFEVFHQLHCLNLIRQFTWYDYYFRHTDIVKPPADLRASDVGNRMHVDHCIEALRLSLMCHADTTPYFVMLDPTAPDGVRADFSPHHKCRKFEPMRQWVQENQFHDPRHRHGEE